MRVSSSDYAKAEARGGGGGGEWPARRGGGEGGGATCAAALAEWQDRLWSSRPHGSTTASHESPAAARRCLTCANTHTAVGHDGHGGIGSTMVHGPDSLVSKTLFTSTRIAWHKHSDSGGRQPNTESLSANRHETAAHSRHGLLKLSEILSTRR